MNKKIASLLASGAMLLNVAGPVAAAQTSLQITGNGDSANSDINFNVNNKTSVTQINNADVYNDVNAKSSTGGNDANRNTGGLVEVSTGDATTEVSVSNSVNTNSADVDCCAANDVDVLISGNGVDTDNTVDLDMNKRKGPSIEVNQWNTAEVKNKVDAVADTGGNDADRNTGGDVSVSTGSATTSVALDTVANANSATVGGDGEDAELSVQILGNGDSSDNDVDLDLNSFVLLEQGNNADVYNNVDAYAFTGHNDAERNTGGDVEVDTGDATVDVTVDNMVNFNAADVDCGCGFDVLAKIGGNGVDSDNTIDAYLGGGLEVGQYNGGESDNEVDNFVDAFAKTGWNEVESNTGEADGDPSVDTGDAETTVEVETTGNSNLFGDGVDFDLPGMGFNFNFSFDLDDLKDWLMDMFE